MTTAVKPMRCACRTEPFLQDTGEAGIVVRCQGCGAAAFWDGTDPMSAVLRWNNIQDVLRFAMRYGSPFFFKGSQ